MKRVLVVVSSFRPAVLADMHRARMLAWELPPLGWDIEILTPAASEVRPDAVDSDSSQFFPPNVPIHEVQSIGRRLFELMGSRTHSWRTLWPMYREGAKLLQQEHFDLVYVSTTTFVFFILATLWRRRFSAPYVLDFQDPWFKENSSATKSWRPTAWVRRKLDSYLERRAVTNAAGVVSVSPRYLETLRARYGRYKPLWLADGRNAVIPFGAVESDFNEVAERFSRHPETRERKHAICYVGAGGRIMTRAFRLVCAALRKLREKNAHLVQSVEIKLFGTTYGWKQGDQKFLQNVAGSEGVGDLVSEFPARVSYRGSIKLLLVSSGALILGVDDPGYMPSKLFSYALSGRPLLASLHRASPGFEIFEKIPSLGHVLWFDDRSEMSSESAMEVLEEFLNEVSSRREFDRRSSLEPFLSHNMARRHVELFERCLSTTR
jgi:hypothetical protein